jgi:hypothetical protein
LLLFFSQAYNALFLHKWCLHFIATNYNIFEGKKDFDTVWSENENYMESNKWPSREHLQVLDKYKTKSHQKKIVRNVSKRLSISRSCKCCVM